jgi:hypothetical protein
VKTRKNVSPLTNIAPNYVELVCVSTFSSIMFTVLIFADEFKAKTKTTRKTNYSSFNDQNCYTFFFLLLISTVTKFGLLD